MFFACDSADNISNIKRIAPMLANFPIDKKRCYVLIGFDGESLQEAESRLLEVASYDFMPMAMLYRPLDAKHIRHHSREWRKLQRLWARPAATKAIIKSALS